MGMDLRVVPAEEWWNRGRDSSHDGERDLGLMVTDFLETGGGGSAGDSYCSSDSDSGFPDPSYLSDKIQVPIPSHRFVDYHLIRWKFYGVPLRIGIIA